MDKLVILSIIIAILVIAMGSVGIDCIRKNEEGTKKTSKIAFLSVMIVAAIGIAGYMARGTIKSTIQKIGAKAGAKAGANAGVVAGANAGAVAGANAGIVAGANAGAVAGANVVAPVIA
jgi:hypothetical protein